MNEKYGIELELITDGFNKKINQIKAQADSIKETFNPNDISGIKINNKPLDDYIVKIKGARTELGKFSKINNIQTPKIDTRNIENITKEVEQTTAKLEPISNRFNKVIDKIKQKFSNIKSEPIDIDVEDAELDLLKYKISELEEKLQNAGKMHLSTKEIIEARAKLEKLNNEYDRLIANEDESSIKGKTAFNSLSNGIEKTVSKIKRFALSLFSISSIYSLLSRASSAYMIQDTTLANKIQAVWVGLGAILEPIISRIVNIMLKAVKYINIFIKALTGVDLLAKATSKSLGGTNKSAKALSKTLAGFDELNNLDTTSDVSGAGIDPGWADAYNDVEINENIAKIIENIGTGIRKAWEWFTENWQHVVIGIVAVVGAILLFKTIKSLISPTKKFSDTLTSFFNSIGKAVQTIAILGGIALVISQVTKLIKIFAESGLSLSDVAILLGSILGELALAFVAIAVTSNLMDWQGILGATIILGGFALVIATVTGLIDAFSKSGLTVGEVAGLMATIFGTLVVLMGSIAILGPLMTAGLLPFSILIVGISAILIVMAATIPTILDACGKFITTIAPSVIVILQTIYNGITQIILALGTTLPPIINSVGNLFNSIFTGISQIINTVGNVIVKIMQNAGNLVNTVLNSIISFINRLGPAINNFVDGAIRATTKLINFIVSGVEYLINLVVTGVNGIIGAVNKIASKVGMTIPQASKVSIPRFVPKLAVGTNYVPEDQLAYIHKGEAVIPKKFNSQEYFGGSNDETNSLLQTLIEKVENIEINPYTTIRDVGQATVSYIKDRQRQTGRSVIA